MKSDVLIQICVHSLPLLSLLRKQFFNPILNLSTPIQSLITPPQSTHSVSSVVSTEFEALPKPINSHPMQTCSKSGIINQRIHPSL